jgi:GNAT superfamily N-acetyltransferase
VEVRAAVVGDADRIAALNAAGWRAGFRGLISDAYLTAYDGLPRLRHETLAEPGDDDIQLVAVDGEDLVGWVAGGPAHEDDLGPGAYEVRACYVDPARWRTGVGRWLMAALIDRLDPGRWTHLVLWTVRDAAPTNAFYVSLGMVRRPGGAARPGRSSAAGPLLHPAQAHADQRTDDHSPQKDRWMSPPTNRVLATPGDLLQACQLATFDRG